MKKLYYLFLTLFVAMGFAACSQEDELTAASDAHDGEVLMKLNIGAEIGADYSPLTRASSTDDLIGIQVDRVKSDGTVEAHFAYGLFDHLDNISVYLKKEYTYKITATLVKDGKNKLYSDDGNYSYYFNYRSSYSVSFYPFYIGSTYVRVENSFNYNSYYYFNSLSSVTATLAGSSSSVSNYPAIDRLYGEVTNLKPTVGGTVNLEMKRVSFGLGYEVEGLKEGTLDVKVEKTNTNAKVFVNATGVENGFKSNVDYYTFTDMMTAYNRADSYYETFKVSVQHNHSIVNISEDLGSVDVRIYRNKINNIRINISTKASVKARSIESRQLSIVSVEYDDM